MAIQKVQQGPWRSAAVDDSKMVNEEGDSLNLLRRVRQQYYQQADSMVQDYTDPETNELDPMYLPIIDWYRTQGDAVGRLIPEDSVATECQTL